MIQWNETINFKLIKNENQSRGASFLFYLRKINFNLI